METSHTPYALVADEGRIRRIVMNRPQERNLLTPEMMAALQDALSSAEDAHVIIISSDGPAFCVGHDMKMMASHFEDSDYGRTYFEALFAQCSRLMQTIAEIPQPVIAEVHSVAVAAGCQLVAAADLAVAADTAKFGTTGVSYGLYCSTPAVPLTRSISAKRAAELLMTGDIIGADEALNIGLVNRVVPADNLTTETWALATKIAQKSGAVLAVGKQAAREQSTMDLADAYERASRAMVDNLMLADGREGLAAFVEKRQPEWEDR